MLKKVCSDLLRLWFWVCDAPCAYSCRTFAQDHLHTTEMRSGYVYYMHVHILYTLYIHMPCQVIATINIIQYQLLRLRMIMSPKLGMHFAFFV